MKNQCHVTSHTCTHFDSVQNSLSVVSVWIHVSALYRVFLYISKYNRGDHVNLMRLKSYLLPRRNTVDGKNRSEQRKAQMILFLRWSMGEMKIFCTDHFNLYKDLSHVILEKIMIIFTTPNYFWPLNRTSPLSSSPLRWASSVDLRRETRPT